MALNAFRMMMASANQSAAPAPLTDAITQHVGILMQTQTGGSGGGAAYAINKMVTVLDAASPTHIRVFSQMKNAAADFWSSWQVTPQTAGPSLSVATPFGVATDSPTSNIPSGDMVYDFSTDEMVAAVGDLNVAEAFWVNSTNSGIDNVGTRTLSSNITTARVATTLSTAKAAVICLLADTTSIIVLLERGSFDSSAIGPTDLSKNISALGLTDSLGVVMYNTSGNLIKYVTYNISGSTITIDSAVSSGITAASGAKMFKIDSTHFLMVYKKTTDTLAARVVTVATGSSFTLNTEATCVATAITDDPIGGIGQFTTSDYGVCYINGNGQGLVVLMSISGTTVTFNTPYIYHTANDVIATSDYYSSNFIGRGTNVGAIAYMVKSAAITSQTALVKVIPIERNFTVPTWAASWTGNIQITGSFSAGGGSNVDFISLGTDRAISCITANSTTITLATQDLDYSIGFDNTEINYTASGTAQGAALADIGYSSATSAVRRVLMAYGYAGTTVKAVVLSVAQDGSITGNTEATVDSSATWTDNYTVTAINYDVDKTLVLSQRNDGVYGTIVTTSGNTISSTTTPTKIWSAAITSTDVYIGWCVLDSAHIALTFKISESGANVPMGILSISGNTLTLGSTVNIGTAMTSSDGQVSVCQLVAGRGMIGYIDAVSGNSNAWVQPFTWSGTTITLGTSLQITTTNNAIADRQVHSKMAALNSTEAFYAVRGPNKMFLITSSGIGGASADGGQSYGTSAQVVCLKQDCYDKLNVARWTGSVLTYAMAYRV